MITAGVIDSVVNVLPEMTDQFNRKKQANDLAIAEANARAAEARSSSTQNKMFQGNTAGIDNKTWLYIIVTGVVLFLIFKMKK